MTLMVDIRQALEIHLDDFTPPLTSPTTDDLPTARSFDGQPFVVPTTRWLRASLRPAATDLVSFGAGSGYAETRGIFLVDVHEPPDGGRGIAKLERLAGALGVHFRPGRVLSRNAARVRLAGVRWTYRDEPEWVVASMSIEWSVYARNAAA